MRDDSKYIEFDATAPARHSGQLPTAVLLYLGGRSHVVGHRTHAEQELLLRGAIQVGVVEFGPVEGERRHLVSSVIGAHARSWGSTRN
jgi:hypothetical protein